MTKTIVYLTRHGQTEWNAVRKMQGIQDSPLTDLGILQASWLRDAMLDISLDALYASTSQRAIKTAEIIRAERPLHIITYDALREIDMGDWEGKTIDEIQQMDTQSLDTFWRKPTEYVPTNSGESFYDLQSRVVPALNEIIARHPDQTIMIVSHGITLKLMLTHFEQRPLASLWDPPFIQPTALSKVVIEDSVTTLELNGDTTHYKEMEIHT
jgi:probable phosphoglycerate mutase